MKPQQIQQARARLKYYLSDGNWHKARQIPMNSRTIRYVCQAYSHEFISTQKGFRLMKHASTDEVRNAINDLNSRARKLTERAAGLERALHKRECPQTEELPF